MNIFIMEFFQPAREHIVGIQRSKVAGTVTATKTAACAWWHAVVATWAVYKSIGDMLFTGALIAAITIKNLGDWVRAKLAQVKT